MAHEPASGHDDADALVATGEEGAVDGRLRRPFMLTDTQFRQLLNVIEGRQGPLSAPPPTPEQTELLEGFRKTAGAMCLTDFVVTPRRIVRQGLLLSVTPPKGTTRARVFFQSGVKTFDLKPETSQFWLPESTPDSDRIARLEYLDTSGAVLGFTGGETRDQAK